MRCIQLRRDPHLDPPPLRGGGKRDCVHSESRFWWPSICVHPRSSVVSSSSATHRVWSVCSAMTTLARDIAARPQQDKLARLRALEQKVLWLSSWMIHNANHLRENHDGLKVGGHRSEERRVG